jgi:hypothetical protein
MPPNVQIVVFTGQPATQERFPAAVNLQGNSGVMTDDYTNSLQGVFSFLPGIESIPPEDRPVSSEEIRFPREEVEWILPGNPEPVGGNQAIARTQYACIPVPAKTGCNEVTSEDGWMLCNVQNVVLTGEPPARERYAACRQFYLVQTDVFEYAYPSHSRNQIGNRNGNNVSKKEQQE